MEFGALQRGQCRAIGVLDAVGEVGTVIHGAVADDHVVFEETGQVVAREGGKSRADVLKSLAVWSEYGDVSSKIDGIGERRSSDGAVGRGEIELWS